MIDRAHHAKLALRFADAAAHEQRQGCSRRAERLMAAAHEHRELAGVPARAPDLATAERMAQEWRVKYPSIVAAWREANRS